MKVNKTTVVVSIVIGVGALLLSAPFMNYTPDRKELGLGVFLFSLVILHAKPELMGKLYKPDDGEKEEDT